MKRYHEEQHIIARNFKERLRMVRSFEGKWQEQRGRYRKRDAHDCGKTRCALCSHEKVYGIRSHRQEIADQDFREQLQEAVGLNRPASADHEESER